MRETFKRTFEHNLCILKVSMLSVNLHCYMFRSITRSNDEQDEQQGIWTSLKSCNHIWFNKKQAYIRKRRVFVMTIIWRMTLWIANGYMHTQIQYIPRNMHTFFALLCFVVFMHWLIFPYPSGLLHWHCGNLTIAPVPAKQPWGIWINTSCEFIMNDCITTTKQSTTKPCAYFLGYTVCVRECTHPLRYCALYILIYASLEIAHMHICW